MENRYLQIVNRKIREVVKEYKSKGYSVIENPSKNDVPKFLNNFIPDLIAKKNEDNVIIEIKISSNTNRNQFLELENIAKIIEKEKYWRFELIITNPKEYNDNNGELLSDNEIISRIDTSKKILEDDINIAFLSLWTVFETIARKNLPNELYKNNTINGIIKNLYSKSLINHQEYKNLDDFLKNRNNIIHGFNSEITKPDFENLLELILKVQGKSKYSFIYEWIDNVDLDNYQEVYSLYLSVETEGDFGLFKSIFDQSNITITNYANEQLKINKEDEKNALIEYLSDEYMNGLDAETYYSLNYALEKDD